LWIFDFNVCVYIDASFPNVQDFFGGGEDDNGNRKQATTTVAADGSSDDMNVQAQPAQLKHSRDSKEGRGHGDGEDSSIASDDGEDFDYFATYDLPSELQASRFVQFRSSLAAVIVDCVRFVFISDLQFDAGESWVITCRHVIS
jgi:hypothetical protein